MTKTLEDVIGCWTTNPNWNSLPVLAKSAREAASWCRAKTLQNRPADLMRDLRILRARLQTMTETTDSAIARLEEIARTGETA